MNPADLATSVDARERADACAAAIAEPRGLECAD
jgi:hypothetical protein